MGQSLETAVTLQGQVQAALAAKAVTSKGSRTALPTLQRAAHSFSWAACDFRSKLGHSCDTPGASIQAVLAAKAVPSKGSRTAFPTLQRQLATLGQSLDTAVALQGQVQAVLAAKAVTSKGSRTALPTLQEAPHSFSRQLATLGQSLDTAVTLQGQVYRQFWPPKLPLLRDPGLPSQRFKRHRTAFLGSLRLWVKAWTQLWHSRGKYRQFWPPKLSLLTNPGLPSQRFKGPRTAFHGQLATLGQSLETAVTLQGQVQAVLAAKAVTSKGSRTALPTLQRAPHSFSWAACAYMGQSLETAVTLQGQVRQPRPSLRPGRHLGPPEVWNLALSSHGAQARRLFSWPSTQPH